MPAFARQHVRASRFEYFDTPFACFAHRGGYVDKSDAGKENTLYAFGRAVELGYRYLETDLHATRDGELVAFHDRSLQRVTDGRGEIADLTTTQLRQVKVGGGEPVPLLVDLLEEFPDRFFNVDLKQANAIEPLLDLVKRTQCHDRLCVGSFSARRLSAFRRKVDRPIATSFSIPGVILAKLGSYWPALLRIPGDALQIPVQSPVLGLPVPVLNRRMLQAAHAADVRVQIWTVNRPDQMHELIELGVDGIMADRVDVLKRVAVEHGVWYGD